MYWEIGVTNYCIEYKDYHCSDLISKHFCISWHATFLEHKMFFTLYDFLLSKNNSPFFTNLYVDFFSDSTNEATSPSPNLFNAWHTNDYATIDLETCYLSSLNQVLPQISSPLECAIIITLPLFLCMNFSLTQKLEWILFVNKQCKENYKP